MFEVWPENWDAVRVFSAMGTQWSYAFNGVVGLRYEALPFVLRALALPRSAWPEVFARLRAMESEFMRAARASRNS